MPRDLTLHPLPTLPPPPETTGALRGRRPSGRYYGDLEAWLDEPRDYGSLVRNFRSLHGYPMPDALREQLVRIELESPAFRGQYARARAATT